MADTITRYAGSICCASRSLGYMELDRRRAGAELLFGSCPNGRDQLRRDRQQRVALPWTKMSPTRLCAPIA